MASKDTIQGLIAAINSIAGGLQTRRQNKRDDERARLAEERLSRQEGRDKFYMDLAEKREERDRAEHEAKMRGGSNVPKGDALDDLNKVFSTAGIPDEGRAAAMRALAKYGGDVPSSLQAIEEEDKLLVEPVPPKEMEEGRDYDAEMKVWRKNKDALDQARSALQIMQLNMTGQLPRTRFGAATTGKAATPADDASLASLRDMLSAAAQTISGDVSGNQMQAQAGARKTASSVPAGPDLPPPTQQTPPQATPQAPPLIQQKPKNPWRAPSRVPVPSQWSR